MTQELKLRTSTGLRAIIHTVAGDRYQYEVQPTESVRSFRKRAVELLEYRPTFRIIYLGRVLEDEQTFLQVHFQDGDTLLVVGKKEPQEMEMKKELLRNFLDQSSRSLSALMALNFLDLRRRKTVMIEPLLIRCMCLLMEPPPTLHEGKLDLSSLIPPVPWGGLFLSREQQDQAEE